MAELIQTKNLKDADVGISESSGITVTSAAPNIGLRESNPSIEEAYNIVGLEYVWNGEGYTLNNRGGNDQTHIVLETFAGKPITEIADSAFEGDTTLISITIPVSVKRIGKNAFAGCTALTEVTLEDSNKMIIFCKKPSDWVNVWLNYDYTEDGELRRTVWPGEKMTSWDSAERIFYCAIPLNATNLIFNSGHDYYDSKCQKTGVQSSYIKNNICFDIKAYSVPNEDNTHYTTMDYYAPQNFTLHESLFIDETAFKNCNKLGTINIPGRTTHTEKDVFSHCTSLESFTIPDNSRLVNAGGGLFEYCSNLKSAVLPEGLATLGSGAFTSCSSLRTCVLPSTLENILFMTFSKCSALTSVVVRNNTFLNGGTKVNKIGGWVFENCSSLREINIPASVKKIDSRAFNGSAIEQVNFAQPKGWFVSKTDNPENANATLIKPAVLKDGMNAACLLREKFKSGIPDHNNVSEQNPIVHVGDNGLYHAFEWESLDPSKWFSLEDVSGYMDWWWFRREQMIAPTISIADNTLTMTDPWGVAESFYVYVNGGKRCEVYTPLHPEYSGTSEE